MKIALLSPGSWWTHPKYYEPWETVVSLLYEGLVKRGVDVTLFTSNNSKTKGKSDCLFENAGEFDLIHNYFDFIQLSYSRLVFTPMVSTICRLPSSGIVPVFREYGDRSYYVSISDADRNPSLNYISTVYHGIDVKSFTFSESKGSYLVCFGSIHPDNGTDEAIEIARKFGMKIVLAGTIQDRVYFDKKVTPHLDNNRVVYQETVDQPSRNELLGGAYALLHPSHSVEPFDLRIVESMACGTPVVAFSGDTIAEFVRDCETGYLADGVEETLKKLKQIPGIDRSRCRRWVEERFGKEIMVDNYLSVYEKVLELERHRARHAKPPWGRWEVLLEESTYKVKRVTVLPGKRLSYQKHSNRNEHWSVISGSALVTIDGKDTLLEAGQAIDIPREAAHRVSNPGQSPLVFIEIQRGSYLGEDDIVRLEDDYGRS